MRAWPLSTCALASTALPLGVPGAVLLRLQQAVARAVEDARFRGFMEGQGFGIRYLDAEATAAFLEQQEGVYRRFFAG